MGTSVCRLTHKAGEMLLVLRGSRAPAWEAPAIYNRLIDRFCWEIVSQAGCVARYLATGWPFWYLGSIAPVLPPHKTHGAANCLSWGDLGLLPAWGGVTSPFLCVFCAPWPTPAPVTFVLLLLLQSGSGQELWWAWDSTIGICWEGWSQEMWGCKDDAIHPLCIPEGRET